MNCQARVKGPESYEFDGKTFWTTVECSNPFSVKFTIDDGDAVMRCCKTCKLNYLRRKQPKAEWLGWFDDVYPPLAPVRGSNLYYETLFAMYLESYPKAKREWTSVKVLEDWFLSLVQEEEDETPSSNLREEEEEEDNKTQESVPELESKMTSLTL